MGDVFRPRFACPMRCAPVLNVVTPAFSVSAWVACDPNAPDSTGITTIFATATDALMPSIAGQYQVCTDETLTDISAETCTNNSAFFTVASSDESVAMWINMMIENGNYAAWSWSGTGAASLNVSPRRASFDQSSSVRVGDTDDNFTDGVIAGSVVGAVVGCCCRLIPLILLLVLLVVPIALGKKG